MEQEQLPYVGPTPDRDSFARVWRRVMPADRPDCPFTLSDDEERRLMPNEPTPAAREEDAPLPPACLNYPAAPIAAFPSAEDNYPCLGAASAVHGALLQGLIGDELTDARTYRNMAGRVSGRVAVTLLGIAADELRHAKRLSAAYFLISGVRFWPDRLPGTPMGTFWGGLRARFGAEQKGERAYRAAAGSTADPCLRELFLELAGDEGAHAWLLRGILEQM